MKISEIRSAIVPKLNAFSGVPIIEADQTGPKPDGPHATFKFTVPSMLDVGILSYDKTTYTDANGNFFVQQTETFKFTMSFTAYATDNDLSYDLAQTLRDWFQLDGADDLQVSGIAVVDLTAVDNRDAFVVDDYERRNGFDMIGRAGRDITKASAYIESVDITKQ